MAIHKEIPVSTYNKIYIEIEETFTENEYSILVHDLDETIWVEKFTKGHEKAIQLADELYEKYKDHQ